MAFRKRRPKNYVEPGFYVLTRDIEIESGTFEKGTAVKVTYDKEEGLTIDDGEGNQAVFEVVNDKGDLENGVPAMFKKTEDLKVIERALDVAEHAISREECIEKFKKKHPIKYRLLKLFGAYKKGKSSDHIRDEIEIAGFAIFLVLGLALTIFGCVEAIKYVNYLGTIESVGIDEWIQGKEIMSAPGRCATIGCIILLGIVVMILFGWAGSKIGEHMYDWYLDSITDVKGAEEKEETCRKLTQIAFDSDEMTDKAKLDKIKKEQGKLTFGQTVLEQYDDLFLTRTVKDGDNTVCQR